MRTRLIVIAILAAVTAVVVSACGGAETEGTAQGNALNVTEPVSETSGSTPSNRVTVKMGEWFFRTDHARVKAGKVIVTARNVGDVEHELLAVKTDLPVDQMPMTSEGLDVDKAGELVIGEPHAHADAGEHSDADHSDEHGEHSDAGEHSGDEADSDGHGEHSDAGEHSGDEADSDEHGEHSDAGEHSGDEADSDGHGSEAAEEGHLKSGETRRYEVDLKPGKYVLLCSIPGHYQLSQYISLVVVE
ncbi:MAG: hypothetical protein FVQ78_04890 [Solirubrobacterales bacterium]|nr:hypothetical protein [Solirubrobacterales bacterium]